MAALMETEIGRRPLKSRQTAWANTMAALLVRWSISPNAISIGSVVCAFTGAVAIFCTGFASEGKRGLLFVVAIAGLQGRLLCNLLDGMVALGGGQKTKSGAIFNDLPDRIADMFLCISAGYAARLHPFALELGYMAAALAIFTAYVRMLGGASGLNQSFIGPMAKQHRMAALTAACLLSIFEPRFFSSGTVLWVTLIIVNAGCLITIWRRTGHIAQELESR